MCGLISYYNKQGLDGLLPSLRDATTRLTHRGPDNMQLWDNGKAFMGHTRLTIIDKQTTANQPFVFENLVLVYNGEVFNYIELREELVARGYAFDTSSDTEVVIKAFHAFGTDCFAKFNGMWALSIYDTARDEFVLSRDRFGQKPLFYAPLPDGFMAASELHAMLGIVETKPDFPAIAFFLKEGRFDANGHSFFEDIFEFPNACYARIKAGKLLELSPYWDYPTVASQNTSDYEDFHALLEDATRLRLRTDVDYCLLLSGGVDSSVLAGIIRDCIGDAAPLSAFTFSSADQDDEASYATKIAEGLNIDIHIEQTTQNIDSYLESLRHLVRNLGRGHSSPAIFSVDLLYEKARAQGCKVVLDGQGADELLAGYDHYHYHLLWNLLKRGHLREMVSVTANLIQHGVLRVAAFAVRNASPETGRRILRTLIYRRENLFARNYHRPLQPIPLNTKAHNSLKRANSLERYLHKQHTSLLPSLLYYGDIVAMRRSVENRSPFMDHRLIEYAFKADYRLKVHRGKNKAVLRAHSTYKRFAHLLDRRKIGFNSPISQQIRKRMIDEMKDAPIIDWPIFNRKKLVKFLNNKTALANKHETLIFRLYQVHLWQQEFDSTK